MEYIGLRQSELAVGAKPFARNKESARLTNISSSTMDPPMAQIVWAEVSQSLKRTNATAAVAAGASSCWLPCCDLAEPWKQAGHRERGQESQDKADSAAMIRCQRANREVSSNGRRSPETDRVVCARSCAHFYAAVLLRQTGNLLNRLKLCGRELPDDPAIAIDNPCIC